MASVAEAAKHPVLRRFALRKCVLQVGAQCLALVIPDAKDWIRRGDWTPERLRGGEPPYWVQIWPAAIAMARQVSRVAGGLIAARTPDTARAVDPGCLWATAQEALAGLEVLDLGCGLGVPGGVAAHFGGQVTFADKSTDALAFAGWNALQLSGRPHRQLPLDWARRRTAGRFDLMLLADVSYHAMHHGPLLDHIGSCLSPGGVLLHADPYRPASTRFLAELSLRMPTLQGEVVVRQGIDPTRVRMVVASAGSDALQTWSRSLVLPVAHEDRQPPLAVATASSSGVVPTCGAGEQEHPRHGPSLGSLNRPT